MKWTYSIEQKLKAALVLTVMFVFLFIKNVSDKNDFTTLGDTFSVVYEDRLLAESYIYEFSDHLSRKKLLIDDRKNMQVLSLHQTAINVHNAAIQRLIVAYEKTKLTPTEEVLFKDLKKKISSNIDLEKQILQQNYEKKQLIEINSSFDESYYSILTNLNHLSQIQISEGEKLNKSSQKIALGAASQSQFELTLLIVLGLIILGIIFASKSLIAKIPQAQRSSLN